MQSRWITGMDEPLGPGRRLALSLWRGRWVALGVAWVLCLGGWFWVAALPDRYAAVARAALGHGRALLDSAVLGLGLAGGIGFALLRRRLRRTFETVGELRRLDLPVAGGISLVAAMVPWHRRLLRFAGFAVALLLLCAVWGGLVLKTLRAGGA